MRVYFAAPLFNVAERTFNTNLTIKIEEIGFKVFLPQRDGVENTAQYLEAEKEQRRKLLFETDRNEILKSDIFLFVLDGRVPDEGACVELGMAYLDKYINKKKKIIVGIHTDSRSAFMGSKPNPMVRMAFDCIINTELELIEYLKNIEKK